MKMVEVEIFGRRFRLRTDDAEATQRVAESIDNQIKDLHEQYENLDFSKLLLLLALKQQEEIHALKDHNADLAREAERVTQMVGKIVGET